ncbi:hypothetical protein OGAPHI_003256 [Ogataea philodendri]|uniref:L-lactate dehydrogenase (cytochrome) n=1 Tax=Ogataea philodendri TaxID=1378263 RepID=A0A9P8P8K5_9ASCO|nr:uncharacterized protein OGAPHI_003256 [Ogataea philodendri]KAH3666807.1 hypothetical protein OGAPHI_003256 [Ogataea philodendri]
MWKSATRALGVGKRAIGRHHARTGVFAGAGLALVYYELTDKQPVMNDFFRKSANSNTISVAEYAKHTSPDDCWVAIRGQVYDMTEFLPNHPGGRAAILRVSGYDATEIFEQIHPKGTIEKFLPKEKHLGQLDAPAPELQQEMDEAEVQRLENVDNKPSLDEIMNLHDMEYIAKNTLPRGAWAYYSSGADDEITLRENHYAYQRIYFRPRVLVDVSKIDTSTTLLGTKSSVPFYVSATALAKLGHPDGECSIARGAGKEGVIQMISTLASNSLDEIAASRIPGATQWFQLYVNEDRNVAFDMVKRAEQLGMKAIFVTVDAPSLGNREKDARVKFKGNSNVQQDKEVKRDQGASRALSAFIDTRLTWDDVKKIKSTTKLPVLIKGVQRLEDVEQAIDDGFDGVVLSNHGGRQLDTAPTPIELLAEVVPELKRKNKLRKDFEIFVDGGVRRGTDILKAIAIGGNDVRVGVGLGRPFLYANSAYGEDGVRKAVQILKDELEMNMRLLGVRNIDELNSTFVDTRRLLGRSAPDELYDQLYSPLKTVKFKNE